MRIKRSAAAALTTIVVILSSSASVRAETINHITTNVTFWSADLKVNLTGFTPGAFSTNGVLARTRAVPVRVTSQDIIRALTNQLAFTIGLATTNYIYETIEYQAGPNITNTHYVEFKYPVLESAAYPMYSPQAKLMVLQPLAEAQVAGPLYVVRDGTPPIDYVINNYFTVQTQSVINEPENDSVATGQIDIVHGLVSATQNAVKRFTFDSSAFGGPPAALFFDVSGWTTERLQPVIRGTNVIDGEVVKSFSASVAGTGRRAQGGFTVLRGSISTENGKLEMR